VSDLSVLPAKPVEIGRGGSFISPIPAPAEISSRRTGWRGIALESFRNIPPCSIPVHEHPAHFLNLLTAGQVKCKWTSGGHSGSAEHGPGTIFLLPAGTRDSLSWSGPTSRIVTAIEPQFLARAFEESAHLPDVELREIWTLQDRHIQALMRALLADLEDGSPAGPLYGESLGVALAHYLTRRYAVRNQRDREHRGGMPSARLNRVVDFIRQNCGREIRLWELANLAGMSPHYFCQLFKQSTGTSPHQFLLRSRIARAKELLRNRDFTVSHAAVATGFADQSHFTKVFRRMVGVTPVQFRALL